MENRDYFFPYTPYPIQIQLMDTLYATLNSSKKVGILESPTGTGKTMSLLCGTLRWVRDYYEHEKSRLKEKSKAADISIDDGNNATDWITAQSKNIIKREDGLKAKEDYKNLLANLLKRESLIQRKIELEKLLKKEEEKMKYFRGKDKTNVDEKDTLFEIEDDFDESYDEPVEDNPIDETNIPTIKVIFASRTHSQLAQVLPELKKTCYKEETMAITMASRNVYCVNESVKTCKATQLINERCLELQKVKSTKKDKDGKATKKSKGSSCSYLQNSQEMELVKVNSLIKSLDIEDLVKMGNEHEVCPYYATRNAISDANFILMPYQTLLDPDTRAASGVDLRNSIVIIDEAHNLVETINSVHSVEISGQQIYNALQQIHEYKNRYKLRFSYFTVLKIGQIIHLLKLLHEPLGCSNCSDLCYKIKITNESHTLETLDSFLTKHDMQYINIKDLIKFVNDTKLTSKVRHLTLSSGTTVKDDEDRVTSQSIISVLSFIKKLTSDAQDGRILISKMNTVGESKLKYILLNPSSEIKDLVNEARCIIVAGGTMKPFQDFTDMFQAAGVDPNLIETFSCSHVVKSENVLPLIIKGGFDGKTKFDFSFTNRKNETMIRELGNVLVDVANTVPDGVVLFFPSYAYEKIVYQHWQIMGILDKIEKFKKIIREPSRACDVDATLDIFADSINNPKRNQTGAMLFAVVGGKMSEGVNFADRMCRCVIVIGLPFPNSQSPELKERMAYYDKKKNNSVKITGQMYYENLCYRAVNQCIGRAIRNKEDYASMLLIDTRYSSEKSKTALPNWVQTSLKVCQTADNAFTYLREFFQSKNSSVK